MIKCNGLFSPQTIAVLTNTELEAIKKKLNLVELPREGGFYRETYRSKFFTTHTYFRRDKSKVSQDNIRSAVTLIYYLLEGSGHFSAFHRLKSDEIWHFYRGSPVTIYVIDNKGRLTKISLGNDIGQGEQCHVIISAGLWFGARVDDSTSFALIGCTVTPGFDYKDFELGTRSKLIRMFPKHEATILSLTNE
jgi:predicted cupin superfamily sugar epimerase